jgi:hypothetical protein
MPTAVPESFPLTLTPGIGGTITVERDSDQRQFTVPIRANGTPSRGMFDIPNMKQASELWQIHGLRDGYSIVSWDVTDRD